MFAWAAGENKKWGKGNRHTVEVRVETRFGRPNLAYVYRT